MADVNPVPISWPSLSVRKDDYGDQKKIFQSVSGVTNALQQTFQKISSAVNQSINAVATMLASSTAPTAASTGFQSIKGVFWHDTGTNTIWLRDQADSTWIEIGTVDESGKAFNPANAVPTGSVMPFAGSSAPSGWSLCDGSAISRTTFSNLFSVIGTTYGAGNGSTTFNVPDLRGRVVAGFDSGNASGRLTGGAGGASASALGNNGGEQAHSLSSAELASHTHTVSGNTGTESVSHTHSVTVPGNIAVGGVQQVFQNVNGNDANPISVTSGSESANHTHAFSATSGSAGSGSAHNNVQPTIVLNYIIKN